jgi:hypothetical protein
MLPAPVASPSDPSTRGPRPRRRSPLAVAVLVLTALVAALAVPAQAQDAPETTDPVEAAAGWLARQLVDGERFESSFDGTTFLDQGLTADFVIAAGLAGVASDDAQAALAWLGESEVWQDYSQWGAVGPASKLALVALIWGLDPRSFGEDEVDLIAILTGAEWSEQTNPVVLSLAVISLTKAGVDLPESLVDQLLAIQCDDGSFENPFPAPGADGCPGGVDGAGFGLQALLLIEPDEAQAQAADGEAGAAATSQELDAAIASAVEYLLGAQGADGSFGSGNPNSTGVAGQALRAAGRTSAADAARAFLLDLQLGCDAAVADRGAFPIEGDPDARATAQAVYGLDDVALVDIDATGAAAEAPVLACAAAAPPAGEPVTEDPVTEIPVPVTEPGVSAPATAAQATPTFTG